MIYSVNEKWFSQTFDLITNWLWISFWVFNCQNVKQINEHIYRKNNCTNLDQDRMRLTIEINSIASF